MAAAWRYAEDGEPMPADLVNLSYIDRFGAQAVLGRCLGYGEMRRMIAAENVVKAHGEMKRAGDWTAWAERNPEKWRLLTAAMKAANDGR